MNTRTTVQESRHKFARVIFHGRCGQIYREGQEDQLGALGLTSTPPCCGTPATSLSYARPDTDVARLSPPGNAHLNYLDCYSCSRRPKALACGLCAAPRTILMRRPP
ncbi:hypothetical protein Franean1_2787 [Parafrankia sp. EAN1pec]|nr:hypothetical protein Franean1_2787 [Frankia sp. EAN1pec]